MEISRRKFLRRTASVAGAAGVLGGAACTKAEKTPDAMVGACGLSCMACPLMKAGKCKGCASGKEATAEMLKMKPCPVLHCAAKKGIDYCGTGCTMFTTCSKLIGKPYDKAFIAMIEQRLAK